MSILTKALKGRGWVGAGEVSRRLGMSYRRVRAVASDSRGEVISLSKGYCLLSEATEEEARQAARNYRARAWKLTKRASEIERRQAKEISR